jgi:hypothetical protein
MSRIYKSALQTTKTGANSRKVIHLEPTYPYTAYKLRGVTYIPHYLSPDAFVGPGYLKTRKKQSSAELISAGAVSVKEMLWHRTMSVPQPIKEN